ncbi:MAG: host-nuclease inhibitor Gam family protein [Burkholderiales bacterium]|nr:host-nuclease inhibitor Gam family protein [Burkholderiales bacterium]
MAKAKKKAAAVPQTREEAQSWITLLGQEQRALDAKRAVMNEAIAAVTANYATELDIGAAEVERLLEGVAAWCEAHKADLTSNGKVKTVNLITGEVKWKIDPPSVKFKKGLNTEKAIEFIKECGFANEWPADLFLRTKEEVNKEAILSATPEQLETLKAGGKIKVIRDSETFTVTPFGQVAP